MSPYILVFLIIYGYNKSKKLFLKFKFTWIIPSRMAKKRDNKDATNLANKEFSSINEIVTALTSSLEYKEILSIIMQQISVLLHPQNWSLLLIDEKTNELFFEIAVGEKAERIKDLRLKVGEGIAGWVAEHGEPLLVPDVSKDPRFSPKADNMSKFETKSIICVPVNSKGRTLGVIELINYCDVEEQYKEDDLRVLSILADYTAIAIENARYYDMARRLIMTDELTGLYNSRFLNQLLDGQGVEDENIRNIRQVSMIFIDIDYFKNVNDKYGHLVGSRTLKEFGGLLKKCGREHDVGIRYGGDEFVILLPNTDKSEAYEFAKEIRNKIKKTYFLKSEGLNIKLTASFGVAAIPEDASNYAELIGEADKAMYQVKNAFRDGISLAKTTWVSDF
jgi:diguanylate cyclase (GGDEF)-like protein